MIATFYLTSTGQVTRVIDAPEAMILLQADPGEAWIAGDWLRGWRIDPVSQQPVSLLVFAVTVSPNRIDDVPAGTVVNVGGDPQEVCDDGTVELVVDYAATVTVSLSHPHYEPARVEVPCEV